MINLTKLVVKRPISALIVILGVVIFGVMSIFSMPLELMSEMNMPILLTVTVYPGAGAEDVEKLVSRELEGTMGSLSGIKDITSYSMDNASIVLLQYEYGTNMDIAYTDLKEKLDRLRGSLPDTATDPIVIEMDMNAMDTVTLSISSKTGENVLNYVNNDIIPEFEKLSTVSDVSISGGREEYIKVELQEDKMQQYGVTMDTILSCVASADFSIPGGTASFGNQDLPVRSAVEYKTTESLNNLPIPLGGGGVIRLGDVAKVYDSVKDSDSISRYNGNDDIGLGIQKRQSSSAVTTSRQVMKVVEELNAKDENINIAVVQDYSDRIMSSISSVFTTLVLAIVLSMAVLYVFLGDIKASLIVGSSMPVSLLVAFICMDMMGFTINVLTLGGLVLGVGMMVDNSIVVLDSCFKLQSKDKSYAQAAVEGTQFVMGSIIGSTITTVVVFLPLATLQGMSGQMFKPLGFTIIFSLVASLLSAVSLVPLFFVQYHPQEKRRAPAALFLKKLERGYGNLLRRLLRKKKTVVVVSVALLVVAVAMATMLNVELMPTMDEGIVQINLETKPGLNLEGVDSLLTGLEEMVAAHPDVDRYSLSGGGSGVSSMMGGGSSSITAYLKDNHEMTTDQVVAQWQRETAQVLDCEISVSSGSTTGSIGGGSDFEVALEGNDLNAIRQAADQVQAVIQQHPKILRSTSSVERTNPQAEVIVDPVKAAAYSLTPIQVASNVNMALSGKESVSLRRDGNDYAIWVEYPTGKYDSVSDLQSMILVAPTGASVPLTDIASINFTDTPKTILRMNNQYSVTVSGTPLKEDRFVVQDELNAQVAALQLPEGVSLADSSIQQMIVEEFTALIKAILIAALLVFMVMAVQFDSAKHSLMVMLCIPFSLIGAFGLMLLTGSTLSMTALLGFLILVGTVVNNGILYVDTANEYRKSMMLETALITTGRHRMRSILMTTLTTVLSMLPLVLKIGSGGEMLQGLGVVVAGGLTAATVLTLLLLPSFYLIFDGKPGKTEARKEKRRRLRESPTPDLAELHDDV